MPSLGRDGRCRRGFSLLVSVLVVLLTLALSPAVLIADPSVAPQTVAPNPEAETKQALLDELG